MVPARGGSKTILRKNIRPLNGRPLIAYTLDAVRNSKLVTRAVVSTDDSAIASVVNRYGVELPFVRPASLATDTTPDLPVFQHCLEWLWLHENYRPDVVVHLRPTAPLRRSDHIDQGIEMLMASSEADSVRSVTLARQHPLKMWRLNVDFLEPYVVDGMVAAAEPYNEPRQQLPPAFIQTGSVDVVRTEVIVDQHSMCGKRIKALILDELDSVNIDDELDWALAELLIKRRQDGSSSMSET